MPHASVSKDVPAVRTDRGLEAVRRQQPCGDEGLWVCAVLPQGARAVVCDGSERLPAGGERAAGPLCGLECDTEAAGSVRCGEYCAARGEPATCRPCRGAASDRAASDAVPDGGLPCDAEWVRRGVPGGWGAGGAPCDERGPSDCDGDTTAPAAAAAAESDARDADDPESRAARDVHEAAGGAAARAVADVRGGGAGAAAACTCCPGPSPDPGTSAGVHRYPAVRCAAAVCVLRSCLDADDAVDAWRCCWGGGAGTGSDVAWTGAGVYVGRTAGPGVCLTAVVDEGTTAPTECVIPLLYIRAFGALLFLYIVIRIYLFYFGFLGYEHFFSFCYFDFFII